MIAGTQPLTSGAKFFSRPVAVAVHVHVHEAVADHPLTRFVGVMDAGDRQLVELRREKLLEAQLTAVFEGCSLRDTRIEIEAQ
jgi:hypothetical protein